MISANRCIKFARLALQIGQEVLPSYAHRFSPQRFTLPQLAACVLLKEYGDLDWRGIQELLALSSDLRQCLGLTKVPDYSTLWRFARRWLDAEQLSVLQGRLVSRLGLTKVAVAVDSTGLDPERCSCYFTARRGQRRTRKRYVKLSVSVIVGSLVAASAVADWGPCGDKVELRQLLDETVQRVSVRELYADGGYDAEWVHVWCREQHKIKSWIPPTIHRADGKAGGYWRSRMAAGLPRRYGRRWAAESFFSAMKRSLGAAVRARHPSQQLKEALRKVLAYSIHR
jgi:hypothetical protein